MPRCRTDWGRHPAPATPAGSRVARIGRGTHPASRFRSAHGYVAWFALLLAIIPPRVALTSQAPETTPQIKRIVFLFTDEVTIPGNIQTDRGLRAGFAKDPSFRTEFYQEYLDLTRFGGEAYEQRLAGVLSQKYAGRQPDLLIAIATPALLFAARWGPIVFPGVPLVFVSCSQAAVSGLGPGFNTTGVFVEFDVRGTLQAALRLRPLTHRVVIVSGATRTDQSYLDVVRANLAGLDRQVSFEYLVGLPMRELLDRVTGLQEDAVVYYVSVFRDGTGQDFQPPDAVEMVAARSSVPVFGPVGTYLGHGIVGGHLFSWEAAGVRAAGLALQVLHGANPRDVPPPSGDLSTWMFDARQLRRWGIRESALHAGSQVLFKPPSLWREHPWLMICAIVFFLFETALIGALVVGLRHRRRAQGQQQLLSAIVESSNDAVIGIDTEKRIVSWNRGAQSVFGYAPEEAIGRSAELLVPPDHLQEATSAFDGVMAGRTVAPFETVRLRKAGSPVDVSISDSPIRDARGRIIGISSTQRDVTERKLTEQRARESEARYRLLADNARDVIWTMGLDGRFTYVSPSVEQLRGFTVEEVMGQTMKEALTPESLRQVRPAFESFLTTGRKLQNQWELDQPRKDGSIVHTEVNTVVLRDEEGKPVGILGVSRDITERKHAEESVRASEEKFRQFFQEVPDYCYIVSPQGEILDINSAALAALGYEKEELVGKPLATIYAPESHARMKELFAQWQRTGLIVDEEIVILSKSGERRVVILNVGAERDQHGNIVHSTSVQTDITERKRAEGELRQSQALVAAVFSSLYGNVAVINREGTIMTVNEAWTRFAREHNGDPAATGVGANYLQACRRAQVAGDGLAGEALAAVGSVLGGSRDEVTLEYPCGTPSGERWFEMMVLALRRPEGGAVVAHLDITARKRAELETQRLRQELSHVARVTMMGELTASLAHELNQPLTAILSNAQAAQRLLGDGEPDFDELREILADIVADDDRAGEIIQRLRTLLRKGELEFQVLDVNQLVRDVAGLARSDAIIKNVSVTLDLASDLPRVRADRVQLQQVILNFILNGLDAVMSRPATDRKLLIHTEAGTDGTVKVAVRDSGPGIPPDKLERVFEPFFTTKANGMGMGLAIARSILHSHGGRLWAENAPGGGATFTLALPATR